MNKLLIIGLIVSICLGCKDQTPEKESFPVEQKTPYVDINEEIASPIEMFTSENIKNFSDSLVSYFNDRAGYDISWYETQIDSTSESNYEKITITLKTQTYKTNGMIKYDIFTFESPEEATDFFNDLKTQELIRPYGLNKRPNHILVDSNRVFWHHLEHGYGHRITDLTRIFKSSFNFTPKSTNLDSVSGFNYCKCIKDDANLSEILGSWQSSKHILNHVDTIGYSLINDTLIPNVDTCFNNIPNNVWLDIRNDSIKINSKWYKTYVFSSIDLPDNGLYWKHSINRNESYGNRFRSVRYSEEFLDRIAEIELSNDPLTVYNINLTGQCSATLVKLSQSNLILIMNNKYYELKKAVNNG